MQYSHLSNEELERWVYASPADTAAAREVLLRLDHIVVELTDAEEVIEDLEASNANLDDELYEAREEIRELTKT